MEYIHPSHRVQDVSWLCQSPALRALLMGASSLSIQAPQPFQGMATFLELHLGVGLDSSNLSQLARALLRASTEEGCRLRSQLDSSRLYFLSLSSAVIRAGLRRQVA